jgi:hypothetical protein
MMLSIFLCQKRLHWSGHIVRMDESRVPKDNEEMLWGRSHMGKPGDT